MLDQTKPITLTFKGKLLDKTGKPWEAGTYKAGEVPLELAQEIYGYNEIEDDSFELEVAAAKVEISKPPLTIVAPQVPVPTPTPVI
jgi:hypothetical protein